MKLFGVLRLEIHELLDFVYLFTIWGSESNCFKGIKPCIYTKL